MQTASIRKMVLAAMLAALCCVATLVIQVPIPGGGYVNLGDAIVLLCGWLLGPAYGCAAAGLGSALADLLTGYSVYAPGTLVIKSHMALLACLPLWRKRRWMGALMAEGWMVAGYFLYGLLLGQGAAASAAGIPGNLIQGAMGMVFALIAHTFLKRTPLVK